MNLLKILQLPRWVLTDVHPAFHDSESMTVLEQTSRLYGKMKELIDSYNAWVEETNRLIVEYKNEEDMQDDEFENRIIETMNNYIASVDEKLACQEREFDEVRGLIADLNANIKVEVETATRSIIETMKTSGEFNDIILSTLDEVNERLTQYENEITQKFNNLQAEMQASIDIVENASTDITNLKTDNDKNKNDILTLQTNYYSLDGIVDSLVTDNQTNKNDIEDIKANNESILWVNPNVSETFVNPKISFTNEKYNYFRIFFIYQVAETLQRTFYQDFYVEQYDRVVYTIPFTPSGQGYMKVLYRDVDATKTSIHFGQCNTINFQGNTLTQSTNNFLIPFKIVGYNL